MNENLKVVKDELVVEETKVVEAKKGLLTKANDLRKKHGKKVIAGLALLLVGGVGYALGKKAGADSVNTGDDSYDEEANDDYNSENNTTEF